MTSNRPYLIRALYEWLVDNDLTPYLLVDANRDSVHVPERYVEDGRIVLNVSPNAVRDLTLGNELIAFEARFGGAAFAISLPPEAVLGESPVVLGALLAVEAVDEGEVRAAGDRTSASF